MKALLFFFALGLTTLSATAQDCMGMKFKPGTSYEMLTFNSKDKPIGKMVYTIKDVKKSGGSTLISVSMQTFDEKGKAAPEIGVNYTCTGKELIADLSGMFMGTYETMKDMEVRTKHNQLAYPGQYSTGSKLPDGEMQAEVYNKGTKMMDMDMKVVNRTVESKENLTTPAGTFSVYKINSNMEMNNRAMGIPVRSTLRSVSYRASDVLFDIRTENYNKNGKLQSYTVLNKLSGQ
ncbi:hypothetical protein ACFQ4C_13990 [Larkinella insperata]|uniref:DUF3108 domain-containing protein n=1 Tax=Larkinella insperata TaxID=332158 RepID=A0ABW3Q547_9BACT|nr:hypothetical protein [Larkinella insperata]